MTIRKVALLAAVLTAGAAMPASAQSWKWDWNINGGYSKYSNMLSDEKVTTQDSDVKFSNGGLLGSQLTFWFGKSLGLRFNGTYADRPVSSDNVTIVSPARSGIDHVNLWSGSADLMFRLAQPRAEYTGMETLPYIALGVGAKWHNPAGDNYTCNDPSDGKSWACAPFAVNTDMLELSEANTIMGLAGLGADWRVSRNIAIRTEIGDRIYKPQLSALTATPAITAGLATGTTLTLNNGDARVSKTVHELYGQIGLGFLFGVARPAAVAVIEAPAPAPTPAPTPTVSRENMSVCVVDPTAEGGLRMQNVVLVGGRDTVVVVSGSDRPFATSIGTVTTAGNADWYVRGQPLSFTVNGGNWSYVTYGSPRMINNSDLAFVGTYNGLPLYADRNDVSSFQTELYQVNRSGDIVTVLGNQKTLANNLSNVKVLYVPTQPSGCVFQAVQRQEEVRKGK
jgi:opacity protein-like surface antigen